MLIIVRDTSAGGLQVSLMRQMEKSTRDFADWRKEREKEVMQLRRQVRNAPKSTRQCPAFSAVMQHHPSQMPIAA